MTFDNQTFIAAAMICYGIHNRSTLSVFGVGTMDAALAMR